MFYHFSTLSLLRSSSMLFVAPKRIHFSRMFLLRDGSFSRKYIKAISRENMSSGILDQVRFKRACSTTEAS